MTNLVATYVPTTTRSDAGGLGWGCSFGYSGATGLVVTQLGAWIKTGNTGVVTVSLCTGGANSNGSVARSVTINATTAAKDQMNYAACAPYSLTNGQGYTLVAAIAAGETINDTAPTTYNSASGTNGIFNCTPGNGATPGTFGTNMYAGVDMVFGAAASYNQTQFFL